MMYFIIIEQVIVTDMSSQILPSSAYLAYTCSMDTSSLHATSRRATATPVRLRRRSLMYPIMLVVLVGSVLLIGSVFVLPELLGYIQHWNPGPLALLVEALVGGWIFVRLVFWRCETAIEVTMPPSIFLVREQMRRSSARVQTMLHSLDQDTYTTWQLIGLLNSHSNKQLLANRIPKPKNAPLLPQRERSLP